MPGIWPKGGCVGATIRRDDNGIWVLLVSGALRKEELDAAQEDCIGGVGPQGTAKVLVMVADDFRGWVGEEVWNDMTFFVRHGDRIEKIAIVGDPKWETRMLMFTGAGFRRTPVKYFAESRLAEAYEWLGEIASDAMNRQRFHHRDRPRDRTVDR
jgi:hypothetical protein